jgi:hypothetical protein
VYFRYALLPQRRFVYLSPAIETLTGVAPQAFYADPAICLRLFARDDRRRLGELLRARRGRVVTLRLVREGVEVPVELRAIALVRHRRVVAIEGMVTLAVARRPAGADSAAPEERRASEPVQQRLASLLVEVHDLLHRARGCSTAAASCSTKTA